MDSDNQDSNVPHTSPFEAIRKKDKDDSDTGQRETCLRYLGILNGTILPLQLEKQKKPVKTVDKPFQTILLTSTKWSRLVLEACAKFKTTNSRAMPATSLKGSQRA